MKSADAQSSVDPGFQRTPPEPPSMHDDRREFELEQRSRAAAMASDTELIHRAFDVQIDVAKYGFTYMWNWLGVPIIQLPTDIVLTQEIIWTTRPDIIIETGVARGGSLILSASILRLLGGTRRVVGVDIDIRAHNRESIESHPLADMIDLVSGSSSAAATVDAVQALVREGARVMVILDSDHSHKHVLAELEAYAPLVTPGCFLIVADTGLGRPEAARIKLRDWTADNNPATALEEFLRRDSRFTRDEFCNNKLLITSSPGGYLRRLE